MKKLLFGFVFFVTLQLNAQNYLISFEGEGISKRVSTVNVENITAGTSLTLSGSKILNLILTNGINQVWDNPSMLKIFPNPTIGNSMLEFSPPVAGYATITLFDINGKPIARDNYFLGNLKQDFRLSGLKAGFYLINVIGYNYRLSGKLISNGKPIGAISIEKINDNTQPVNETHTEINNTRVKGTIDMDYSPGELLRFTGFYGDYSSVITVIPTSDKTVVFDFAGIPTITTSAVTATSPTTATSGGTITSESGAEVTDRGVCWSPADNPTIDLNTKTSNGTGTGSFTSNINGLLPVTLYYVRAYATNSKGTAYGNEFIFTTEADIPTLTTTAAAMVTRTEAKSGGNITSNGGSALTGSGICWSTSHNPSITDSHTSDGTTNGSFTSSITDLLPGTLYYIRAYASNRIGTSYGNELSFTTNPIIIPTLTTTVVSSITSATAVSGGNITDNGGASITARGICWATTPSPTISDYFTANGTGTGSFTGNFAGLQPFTLYHVRAYATNSAGTAYGSDLTFTTLATVPTVTTTPASIITRTSATSGGNITSDGGSAVTSSGICWSTSHNPSLTDSHSSDVTANGSFTSSITGLLPGTLYYIRAYASNSLGTSYGNELSFTTNPIIIATLTTSVASSITSSTAVSGGTITDNGGASITARGICWSTTPSPTISNNLTSNGTGTGSFTSNIAGLQPFTIYHVRAYATNSAGTAYGSDLTFTTLATVPTVTTTPASVITRTTAASGGNITSNGGSAVTGSGICWSTSHNPSITDSHTSDGAANGSFTSSIAGLSPGTLYYIRAYASNSVGTSYGNELSFTTNLITIPTLTTTLVSSITSATAVSGGTITDNGGASITARGVCWSTNPSPTISDYLTSNGTGTGSFTSNITGLQIVTTYHVRAYATNSAGTAYGSDLTFTTLATVPTLTTTPASAITRTTASSGGNITSDGGSAVTGSGICWSTSHNPSITDSHTSDGTANGSFTSSMTGLLAGTLYYIRAYASNSAGTSYGNELSFTTNPAIIATITTTVVSSITSATAVSGGKITDNGGSTITDRGVCWSTNPSPTINDYLTSNGTGTGSFTSNITGLQIVTTYHVRAYATNSAGTAYGSDLTFTTLAAVPTLNTSAVSAVTETTATSGGNITTDGGASITAKGVCWGTSANPTINNSKTMDGTGTGSFISQLTGLTPNTRYYVRAYATNVIGTAYGNSVSFMYSNTIPEVNSCKWLRDAPCFLSLSFDDTQAAHLQIANLLNVYGFKGSFYIQSVELELQPNLIPVYNTILLSGHEVGSHTVNHIDLTTLGDQQLFYEIDSSVSRINRYLHTNCTSLAQPYHGANSYVNSILFSHNLFTRDYSEYSTTARLRFDLTSDATVTDVTNFIDQQIANNNSCIIDGHGIDGQGYSPSTTEFFNGLFTYIASVQNNNRVWVTTLSNGALYESLFHEVKLTSNVDQTNHLINIQFDCPNKPIYNKFNQLLYSFKINKSSSWSVQNSGIESFETDTDYIYTIDLKQTKTVTLQYTITH